MIQIQKWKVPSDWQWHFLVYFERSPLSDAKSLSGRVGQSWNLWLKHWKNQISMSASCAWRSYLYQSTAVDGWPWFYFCQVLIRSMNEICFITSLCDLLRLLTWAFIVVPFFTTSSTHLSSACVCLCRQMCINLLLGMTSLGPRMKLFLGQTG